MRRTVRVFVACAVVGAGVAALNQTLSLPGQASADQVA